MTTLAKIDANQRNAQLSTGPRTPEGKAVIARNATRHGIFSSVPVLPGECPETWEAHRAGVVDSLAPEGLLEVNLAECVALLLWRLHRLARYEAETVAAGMEEVEVPPLPPPEEQSSFLDPPPKQQTRDEQLRAIRRELQIAREELAEVVLSRDFFAAGSESAEETAVPVAVAESILNAALGHAEISETLRSDPPAFESKAFLRRLGQVGADPRKVAWTADLVRRGLAVYAGFTEEPAERFVGAVRAEMEDWAEELGRKVRRLEGEEAAVVRLLDGGTARRQVERLMPGDGRDERIAKYERHIHNLLTSTLHELERLQARREGEAVPPPAVADLNVTIDARA